jgi:hypothetical protein
MRICPKCKQSTLLEVRDLDPELHYHVCPTCTYYESNSEAYLSSPSRFDGMGKKILKELETELSAFNLTLEQTRKWAEQEPTFTKRIFTPLDPKRELYRTILSIVLLVLVISQTTHAIAAASPTEISQPHPPTMKVTLPLVR